MAGRILRILQSTLRHSFPSHAKLIRFRSSIEISFCVRLRDLKNKAKVQLVYSENGRGRLRECPLRGCVNTKFVWEFKRGSVMAAVGRAVRLRECPLRQLPL